MSELTEKHCVPCEGGAEPLKEDQVASLMAQIDAGWQALAEPSRIEKTFEFSGYARTIAFANAVAWLATAEGHHPELIVNYGSCKVSWWTHAVGGLSDNDFICAAKVDQLAAMSR